jgi:RNA polymerase sigma-70 factor (family 1)
MHETNIVNYYTFKTPDYYLMKDFNSYTSEELMREIKADNMLAFDALYGKYSRKLYKFGYSILKSKEDSENLIQDVFLNLWENRRKVEKNASVQSYVFTIAYNSAISILRKKAKDFQFIEYLKSLQENLEDPVNVELEYNELAVKLDEIINSLPARQREVYLLHKVEGLKYEVIAEQLHISVNTIENHMSRALRTIRGKLGNYSLFAILFFYLFV